MSIFYIEYRRLYDTRSLSWDLAHHMYTRHMHGTIVVITDKPVAFLSSVSKQWRKVTRQVQRERSSTLQSHRILELTHEGNNMQRLHMVAAMLRELPKDDVYFVTIEELLEHPPVCETLYIADPITDTEFARVTRNMPRHSLVVRY